MRLPSSLNRGAPRRFVQSWEYVMKGEVESSRRGTVRALVGRVRRRVEFGGTEVAKTVGNSVMFWRPVEAIFQCMLPLCSKVMRSRLDAFAAYLPS